MPVDHARIIDAKELGALRDKQIRAVGRVEYVMADLRDDRARKLGIDAGNHHAGDDCAGLEFAGLARRARASYQRLYCLTPLHIEVY